MVDSGDLTEQRLNTSRAGPEGIYQWVFKLFTSRAQTHGEWRQRRLYIQHPHFVFQGAEFQYQFWYHSNTKSQRHHADDRFVAADLGVELGFDMLGSLPARQLTIDFK